MNHQNESNLSFQNSSLAYWTSVLPPSKLVLNVPAYARTYTLRSASNALPGAPVSGPGEPGHCTGVAGFLAYYEVSSNQWTKRFITNKLKIVTRFISSSLKVTSPHL